MTESTKNFNIFQSQKNVSLNQYRSFQNFTAKSRELPSEQRKIIKFSLENQKEELAKLQWRKNTEFPIVKILSYKKLNNQSFLQNKFSSKKILVQLTLQPILYTVQEVDQIPIFKIFYLLKEAIIATERLCALYGNFLLKSNMVGIDSNKKCKVWHNSKFHINKPQFNSQSQEQTVKSVVQVFSSKTKSSLKSDKFYRDLQKCRTFCDCLIILKNFSILSQTRIPSSFMLVDKFSSNMCSPRKFISRPPSNQHNPESPQTSLERFRSPRAETHKLMQSQRWKFAKLSTNRPKINSFTGFKNYESQKLIFNKKSPSTQRNNTFTSFFRRTPRFEEAESISPKSMNKMDLVFPIMSKKILGIPNSIVEDHSDSISVNDLSDQPQIRIMEPVIKKDGEQEKDDTVLYRSTISMGKSIMLDWQDLNIVSTKYYESTNNESVLPLKEKQIERVFHPSMKLVDESFEDASQHQRF